MTIGSTQQINYDERMVGANSPTYSDTLNRHAAIDHEVDGHHKWLHLHENADQSTGANEFLLLVKNDGTQTEIYGRSESDATVFQITKGDALYTGNNIASQADIDTGTDNEKIVTPLLFAQNALQTGDVLGTANQVVVTDDSNATATISLHSDVTDKLVTNGDSHDHSGGDGAQIDHGGTGGLTDDDHTQYLLLAGRSGGQSFYGGTASGDDITIESTSHATKGYAIIQPNGGYTGFGTTTPATFVDMEASSIEIDITMGTFSNVNSYKSTLSFVKSASNTKGTYSETADDEHLGSLEFYGSDSSSTISGLGAYIRAEQDGAAGATYVPVRFAIGVGTNAAVATTKVVVTSTGLGIGSDPSQALDVVGAIEIEDTTTSTTGVIYKGSDRFIHNFHHPTGPSGGATPDGRNTCIGVNAGNFTMGDAATQTYHASDNVFIGYLCGNANTNGYYNLFLGTNAGKLNTTGYMNAFIGVNAGDACVDGYRNLAMGYSAGGALTSGRDNTFVGYFAGNALQTGIYNVCVGRSAGALITGNNNICLGGVAGDNITSGANNIIIGYNVDAPSATGNYQMNIGDTLYGDLSNNYIGINNTSPGHSLDIGPGTGAVTAIRIRDDVGRFYPQIYIENYDNNNIAGPYINFRKAKGSIASPADVGNGDILGSFIGQGYQENAGAFVNGPSFKFEVDDSIPSDAAATPGKIVFSAVNSANTTRSFEWCSSGLGIRTSTWDSSCVGYVAIYNGTEPSAHTDNQIYIGAKDSTDNTSTLSLYLEQAVEVIGTFTASHKVKVWINGTEYWLQLDAV